MSCRLATVIQKVRVKFPHKKVREITSYLEWLIFLRKRTILSDGKGKKESSIEKSSE